MNYNEEMKKEINTKKMGRLLLHSCCAPCSSSVIEKLASVFEITVVFYNPNIEPIEEYLKRKKEQIRFLNNSEITYFETEYSNQVFKDKITGFEKEPENGARCIICYQLRLEEVAKIAKENNFDYFCTTLTVSPYKNSNLINEIGIKLSDKYQVKYLPSDFKKEKGYKRSIELSKEHGLYRQDYCGCLYSRRK